MGRLVLQMMITLDGMVSGPKGELDWMAQDKAIEQNHLARVEHAQLVLLGVGAAEEMADFWIAAENDQKADEMIRRIGRAMNQVRKVVYSHKNRILDWRNTSVHSVEDDDAFAQDVKQLKQRTDGTIVSYGGVRLARSLIQKGLVDEMHLDVCPIVLGEGQPLFTNDAPRTKLELCESATYDSGAAMMHYKVA